MMRFQKTSINELPKITSACFVKSCSLHKFILSHGYNQSTFYTASCTNYDLLDQTRPQKRRGSSTCAQLYMCVVELQIFRTYAQIAILCWLTHSYILLLLPLECAG